MDDDPSVRALFARALQSAGYDTLESADGQAALEIIEERPVALLLVDSMMPRLDGAGLIRILRDREATRTLPIILITARASLDDRVIGLERGADDFLAKPVEIDELIARVRSQLRSDAAWGDAAQRDLAERRALTSALRRVQVDPSPELTARSVVQQFSEGRDGISVALLRHGRSGAIVPLASGGRLARRYRPGVALPKHEARDLLARASHGPWIQHIGTLGSTTGSAMDGDALDAVYLPLDPGVGMLGFMVVATDAGATSADPTQHLARWIPLLAEAADVVTTVLRPGLEASASLAAGRELIERVASRREFVPHFQPIVRLDDGSVVGHEGLTRFADGSPPEVRFAEAERLGLGRALEMATLGSTIIAARTLPVGLILTLNVSPMLLGDPALDALLCGADRDIVLELTEHVPVADYEALRSRIGGLSPSIRIAVDDAGAGYASLRHVVALRPSFVKLDITLVRGIETDPARQALLAGFVHFARETDCQLIGEGIETDPERQTLQRLGVQLGQGYLFGRPVAAHG